MQKKEHRRLKNYLINKDFQLRIMSAIVIHMLIVVLAAVAVISYPMIRDMVGAGDLEVQYRAAQTFLTVAQRLVPTLLVIFVLSILHQMMITHRICGPLVNFSRTFQRIAKGDLSGKVRIRRGDYLKDECDKLNDMIDALDDLFRQVGNDRLKMVRLLEDLHKEAADGPLRDRIEETLAQVRHTGFADVETAGCVEYRPAA
jgi:methyl-accepting chemotaxis protein